MLVTQNPQVSVIRLFILGCSAKYDFLNLKLTFQPIGLSINDNRKKNGKPMNSATSKLNGIENAMPFSRKENPVLHTK